MIDETQLLTLVDEILEAPAGTAALNSDLEELGWDSLSVLNLISIADERFGAAIDEHALAEARTPADLLGLFRAAI